MRKSQLLKSFGLDFLAIDKPLKNPAAHKWNWKPQFLKNNGSVPILDSAALTNYQPQSRKQKVYLVIGPYHSEAICHLTRRLESQGKKFFYIDWSHFCLEGIISLPSKGKAFLSFRQLQLSLNDIATVFIEVPYRQMDEPGLPVRTKSKTKILDKARWWGALKDLHRLTPTATWLPGPPEKLNYQNQNKFEELMLAQKLGIKIPETIQTNDPFTLKSFHRKFKNGVLFREFNVRHVLDQGRVKTFAVEKVKSLNSKMLKMLKRSPCVFQEYIDKSYDLRIILIGDNLFTLKVDSQKSKIEQARIDWRAHDLKNCPWTWVPMPKGLAPKLKKFAKSIGMKMLAFDMVVDKKGQVYFLEANRPGEWFWLEAYTGAPMISSLTKRG